MKSRILKYLKEAEGYVSGEDLCREFNVSRTAVWKVVKSLKDRGYTIDSVTGKGYRLIDAPDTLSVAEIESALKSKWLGRDIVYYDSVDSTNVRAKLLAEEGAGEGVLVAADMQTAGRGRRGRSWIQEPGENVSMSVVLRPNMNPDKASMLTLICACSIGAAIEELTGARVMIKWPNDLLINGRKICGILTEMSAERDYIHYVVAGFGINVRGRAFPDEIKDTASSILNETGVAISRSLLISRILYYLEGNYEAFLVCRDLSFIIDRYDSRLISRGREVRVLDPREEFTGICRGITVDGGLIVELPDGGREVVSSGEVSVRGVYGYV